MFLFKKICFVFCLLAFMPAVTLASRAVEMEDPKEYFLADGKTVSTATIASIIKEALSASSFGAVQWKITNESPGRISVQFGKTSAYANARVEYSSESVVLHYEDSQSLKFASRGNQKFIHPAYNQWVDKFSANLARVAQAKAGIILATRDEVKLYQGIKAGKPLIMVAATGITKGTDLSDMEWAERMSRDLARHVPEASSGKAVGKAMEWSRPMRKLSQKGYKKALNQQACSEHKAGAIVTAWFDHDDTSTTWRSFRNGRFTHYNCATGQLIEKTYAIKPSSDNRYPLENGIKHALKQLFTDHSLY